jgi:hypothetical protein
VRASQTFVAHGSACHQQLEIAFSSATTASCSSGRLLLLLLALRLHPLQRHKCQHPHDQLRREGPVQLVRHSACCHIVKIPATAGDMVAVSTPLFNSSTVQPLGVRQARRTQTAVGPVTQQILQADTSCLGWQTNPSTVLWRVPHSRESIHL